MAYLMSIDLGTSSLKTMIMDEEGNVQAIASEEYEIEIPISGFAEQNPSAWWRAAVYSIRKSMKVAGIGSEEIKGIGLSGQMHGMVLVDKEHRAIRNAIIHSDQRSKSQIDYIYSLVSKEEFGKITLNPVFPGFQLPSILWVKQNEPDLYKTIYKMILPKDYIRLKLTGEVATEYTDASSTAALDLRDRRWSQSIIDKLGLDYSIYPHIGESYDIAGHVTKEASLETGLKTGTPVIFGAADQPMQALGNGLIKPGIASTTIGTGGQIFAPVDKPVFNPLLNTHTFYNVFPDSWYVMGAMMSAGLSLRWFRENIIHNTMNFSEIAEKAQEIPAGSDGLIFLPYLVGERTPHLDPDSKGMFFGLNLSHTTTTMSRAIMEGVTFGLKDSIEILYSLGIGIDKLIASGGGMRSKLWLQIQADVFDREVYTTNNIEQACTGAAILAGIGIGLYSGVEEACKIVVKMNHEVIEPSQENVKVYEQSYHIYKALYTSNKTLFKLQGSNPLTTAQLYS